MKDTLGRTEGTQWFTEREGSGKIVRMLKERAVINDTFNKTKT